MFIILYIMFHLKLNVTHIYLVFVAFLFSKQLLRLNFVE